MEHETERLVSVLSALVVEQVLHDVVTYGEEGAARRICRGVFAIRTRDTTSQRSCSLSKLSARMTTRVYEIYPTTGTLEGGRDGDEGEQSFEGHLVG